MVSTVSDVLPFHNDEENYSFTGMAARRFKYMFEDVKNEADIVNILDKDQTYRSYKTTLLKLIKGQNPNKNYGYAYR